MKIVINRCFGGFGLSDAAYRRLIDLGIPVRKYIEETRDPETKLFRPEPSNEGEVILDYGDEQCGLFVLSGTSFSASWLNAKRNDPRLVQVVESLGAAANGPYAKLAVVEIPDDVQWEIDEYDGNEIVREVSRTWS